MTAAGWAVAMAVGALVSAGSAALAGGRFAVLPLLVAAACLATALHAAGEWLTERQRGRR